MNAKQMREKRAALVEQMQGMVSAAKAEERNLNNEENAKFDAISNEVDELRAAVARVERAEELKKEMAAKEEIREAAPAKKVEAREAFSAYLRKGIAGMNAEERAALGELRGTSTQIAGTDSLGGFLVPEDMSSDISVQELFKSEMEKYCRVINTASGNKFQYPAVNDTGVSAAILGEGTAETVSDMTFSNIEFDAYTYSSKVVKVSHQLLQDSAFDLNGFLAEALGERIARGVNGHLTDGSGSSQPQGVVTGSSLGKTAAAAAAVTNAEILDLMYSVDASYRNAPGAAFMMNSATLAAVRKLGFGSSNDHPIFVPAAQAGGLDLVHGKPVIINEDMDGIATGKKSILFGDMRQYAVRNAGGVQLLRLDERFADSLSVGFIAYKRVDGNILQGSAIKHLIQA